MKVLGNAIVLVAGIPLIIGGLVAVGVVILGATLVVLANRAGRFVRA